MKPKIFIGASTPALPLARALQELLDQDAEFTVWDQGFFGLTKSVLENLTERLPDFDFGIFVCAPDDPAIIKGQHVTTARDNVIFEMGIVVGCMGRAHSILVAPSDVGDFHLPTDLAGVLLATYSTARASKEPIQAMAVASNKIRRHIQETSQIKLAHPREIKYNSFFTDFHFVFQKLFAAAKNIEIYFIHSRRWREDYNELIRDFLAKPDSKLTVYLPDRSNDLLMQAIRSHFNDGEDIPAFLNDAYRCFETLLAEFEGKVSIFRYQTYPTYSFYKFDDDLVIAMYPTTPFRRNVPTFLAKSNHPYGAFVCEDLKKLREQSRKNP